VDDAVLLRLELCCNAAPASGASPSKLALKLMEKVIALGRAPDALWGKGFDPRRVHIGAGVALSRQTLDATRIEPSGPYGCVLGSSGRQGSPAREGMPSDKAYRDGRLVTSTIVETVEKKPKAESRKKPKAESRKKPKAGARAKVRAEVCECAHTPRRRRRRSPRTGQRASLTHSQAGQPWWDAVHQKARADGHEPADDHREPHTSELRPAGTRARFAMASEHKSAAQTPEARV